MIQTRILNLYETTNPMETAITLAQNGFYILPLYTVEQGKCTCGDDSCESPGKHPHWPLVPHGVKDATRNLRTIERWWNENPNLNVGVSGGEIYVIIDWDTEQSYLDWKAANPDIANTLTVKTPGRGYHAYFELAGEESITWYDHGSGEVRGSSAYVVAPPSLHINGIYEWIDNTAGIIRVTADRLPPRKPIVEAKDVDWSGEIEPIDVFSIGLGKHTLKAIHNPSLLGSKTRSVEDFSVVIDLLRCDATAEQIFYVYESFPIGQQIGTKYHQKQHHAAKYLLTTIGKAAAVIEEERNKIAVEVNVNDSIIRTVITQEQREAILDLPADDDGNAQAIKVLFGDRIIYDQSYGWLWYNGKYWQRQNAVSLVKDAATQTMRVRQNIASLLPRGQAEVIYKKCSASNHATNSAMNMLIPLVLNDDVDNLDGNPDIINCSNGVLDLRTGTLTPHHPTYLFTYILNTAYKPDADQSMWKTFIESTLTHKERGITGEVLEELIGWFQESVGYWITGNTREEALWYLYGPPRSGKGAITETLMALMGELAEEVDFKTFTRRNNSDTNNFDLAGLKGKRAVFASESRENDYMSEAAVKVMTGGNRLRCAFKGKDAFSYRPTFKAILSSNETPKASPEDKAAWARVRVIECPNSHVGSEDKFLKERLRKPEVLEGVLVWAVEGAKRWYKREATGLLAPRSVVEAVERFRSELDTVGLWIDENVVVAATERSRAYYMTSHDVYEAYRNWAEQNGFVPLKQNTLTRILGKKGFDSAKVSVNEDGRSIPKRCILGMMSIQTGRSVLTAYERE